MAEPHWWEGLVELAVDPDMPEGVIAYRDAAGLTWRLPLAEFTDWPPPQD